MYRKIDESILVVHQNLVPISRIDMGGISHSTSLLEEISNRKCRSRNIFINDFFKSKSNSPTRSRYKYD